MSLYFCNIGQFRSKHNVPPETSSLKSKTKYVGAVGENPFNYSRYIVPPRLTMLR